MKNHTIILSVILLLSTKPGISQNAGDILWKELYGGNKEEVFYDVQQTLDNGYIAVGYTTTYGPVQNVKSLWVVRTDTSGNIIWTQTFGLGISFGDWANAVAVCPDGSFVVVGETYSYAQNEKDAWILKLDGSGNIIWDKTYSGPSYDAASSVIINNTGNYSITGFTFINATNRDALYLEYDPNGNLISAINYGGNGEDWTTDLSQAGDDGYFLSGYTKSFGVIGMDLYLIKIDSDGDTVWTMTYGGNSDQFGRTVEALPNGNAIVSGWTGTFITDSDILLLEVSSDGTILWTKTYAFGAFNTSNDMIVTPDGGYLIAGKGNDNFLALKTSPGGDIEWIENSFNATGIAVILNDQNNYMIGGAEHVNYIGQGLLVCLQGEPVNQPPAMFSLLEPADGDTLTSMIDPVLFAWEPSIDPENDDILYTLAIFNANFNMSFPFITDTTFSFNGSGLLEGNTIYNWAVSASDGLLYTTSDTFAFVTPLAQGISMSGLETFEKNILYQNYPNPVSSVTTVSFMLAKSSHIILSVYDSRGTLIETLFDEYKTAGAYSVKWDASHLQAGVYILSYYADKEFYLQKAVKK
ncbi:MAG: T9SS type A sorting domain-containing protein [Bacteroidota bacterium]